MSMGRTRILSLSANLIPYWSSQAQGLFLFTVSVFGILRLARPVVSSAFVKPLHSLGWIKSKLGDRRPSPSGVGVMASSSGETLTPTGAPMPAIVHRILSQEEVKERVLVIGDIHGCLDELQALLARAAYDPKADTVIIVGDLVNKGPKSAEVVRFVRENGFYCVRGNHDDSAIAAAWRVGKYKNYLPETYQYTKRFSREDAKWLRDLPYSISVPHLNALMLHAGLLPGVPLERQKASDMSRIRGVLEEEGGSTKGLDYSKEGYAEPWASLYQGPMHVYFGHDAKRGLQLAKYATGLDTGCCYGRELTAAILPSGERISVPAFKEYAKANAD